MRRHISTFIAAVLLLGATSYVRAQEQTATNPAGPWIAKPKTKSMGVAFDYYPHRELHENHTGYVLIEYSINDRGRPTDQRIVESTSSPFSDAARDLLREFRYAVPGNWSSMGGPAVRYQIQFHFNIVGYPIHEGHLGIEDVVITGQHG